MMNKRIPLYPFNHRAIDHVFIASSYIVLICCLLIIVKNQSANFSDCCLSVENFASLVFFCTAIAANKLKVKLIA
jgi:hypothetical protein